MDRILRGTVTRVDARGVYVEIPKLGQGVEYGPCQVVMSPFVDTTNPGYGATMPAGGHTHTATTSVSVSDSYTGSGSGSGSTSIAPVVEHRHVLTGGARALQPGMAVLMTTVNGVKDDLVVLGRLA